MTTMQAKNTSQRERFEEYYEKSCSNHDAIIRKYKQLLLGSRTPSDSGHSSDEEAGDGGSPVAATRPRRENNTRESQPMERTPVPGPHRATPGQTKPPAGAPPPLTDQGRLQSKKYISDQRYGIVDHQLSNWCILLTSAKGVILSGNYSYVPDGEEGSRWNSSVITERLSPRVVRTKSGTIYNLVGPYISSRYEHDLPEKMVYYFRNGFPKEWKELVASVELPTSPVPQSAIRKSGFKVYRSTPSQSRRGRSKTNDPPVTSRQLFRDRDLIEAVNPPRIELRLAEADRQRQERSVSVLSNRPASRDPVETLNPPQLPPVVRRTVSAAAIDTSQVVKQQGRPSRQSRVTGVEDTGVAISTTSDNVSRRGKAIMDTTHTQVAKKPARPKRQCRFINVNTVGVALTTTVNEDKALLVRTRGQSKKVVKQTVVTVPDTPKPMVSQKKPMGRQKKLMVAETVAASPVPASRTKSMEKPATIVVPPSVRRTTRVIRKPKYLSHESPVKATHQNQTTAVRPSRNRAAANDMAKPGESEIVRISSDSKIRSKTVASPKARRPIVTPEEAQSSKIKTAKSVPQRSQRPQRVKAPIQTPASPKGRREKAPIRKSQRSRVATPKARAASAQNSKPVTEYGMARKRAVSVDPKTVAVPSEINLGAARGRSRRRPLVGRSATGDTNDVDASPSPKRRAVVGQPARQEVNPTGLNALPVVGQSPNGRFTQTVGRAGRSVSGRSPPKRRALVAGGKPIPAAVGKSSTASPQQISTMQFYSSPKGSKSIATVVATAAAEVTKEKDFSITAKRGTLKFSRQKRNFLKAHAAADNDDDGDFLSQENFHTKSVYKGLSKHLRLGLTEQLTDDEDGARTPRSNVPVPSPVSERKTPNPSPASSLAFMKPTNQDLVDRFIKNRRKNAKRLSAEANGSQSQDSKLNSISTPIRSKDATTRWVNQVRSLASDINTLERVDDGDENDDLYFGSDSEHND